MIGRDSFFSGDVETIPEPGRGVEPPVPGPGQQLSDEDYLHAQVGLIMEENRLLKDELARIRALQGARKTSDLLTDRLTEARLQTAQAERECHRLTNQNQALQEQVRALHVALRQPVEERGGPLAGASGMHGMRSRMDLEAESQALRQEIDLSRHAVRDKEQALERLTAQCHDLGDALEDRDRELDRLRQVVQDRSDTALGAGPTGRADPIPSPAGEHGVGWRQLLLAGLLGLVLGIGWVAGGMWLWYPSLFQEVLQGPNPPPSPTVSESPPPRVVPSTAAPAPGAVSSSSARGAPLRDPLRDGGKGPALVWVNAGRFTMGGGMGAPTEELPVHEVRLGPLYMGRTEVSFEEYDRFALATGRPLPDDAGWGRGRQPVINLTWEEARAYGAWLSVQTGKRYRLPSEAEWEYGARGGTELRYWWGYQTGTGNAVCFDCGSQWDNRRPAPVASLAPNPYGLHDTAGNVMEWVEDCFHPNYQGAPADGSPWNKGQCGHRVARGGAYNKPARSVRSSSRAYLTPDARLSMLGFRVAREP